MTIVVWDGKTLAGDRFSTRRTTPAPQEKFSEANKIYIPTKPLKMYSARHKHRLKAYAMAGGCTSIAKVNAFINGLEEDSSVHEALKDFFSMQLREPDVVILLLGERGELTLGARTSFDRKGSLNPNLMAIGSGASLVALLGARFPDLTAIDYVYLASVLGKSFGGGISSYNLEKDKLTVIRTVPLKRSRYLSQLIGDVIMAGDYPRIDDGHYVK